MYFYTKLVLALSFTFTLLFSSLSATNYYVDSKSGNDSNNGLAPSSSEGKNGPWKTLNKMMQKGYSPGDSILLKRGSEWTGVALKASRNGREDARIYYGAYGTGTKPTITNADIIVDADYIIIDNLISKSSPSNGVARKTGRHVIIRNIEVYNAGQNGIRIVGYNSGTYEDVLVEGCTVESSRVDGITIHKGANYSEAGSGFILRNNTSSYNGEQGFDITTGTDILVEGNITDANNAGSVTMGRGVRRVTVKKHFSTNDVFSLTMKRCWEVRVEYSIFVGNAVLVRTDDNSDGGSPSGVTIVNNVFWQKGNSEAGKFFYTDGDVIFKNNFFKGAANTPILIFKKNETPAASGNYTFENNYYYDGTEGNSPIITNLSNVNYNLQKFQRDLNQETLGGVVNPGFQNYTGAFDHPQDFQIKATSNLIDKGSDVGAYEDFEGTAVPQGGIPDIGAFEVVAEGFLPVEWDQFEVTPDVDRSLVDISWSTNTEINNQYFTVEKSIDGSIFQSVETVQSKGEGQEKRNYRVEDNSPAPGVSYYRIKQVDFDGRFSYSPIVRTEFSQQSEKQMGLFPSLTQAGERLTITHSHSAGEIVEIKLMDIHGRSIATKNSITDSFQTTFDLPNQMIPGYYIMTVSLGDSYKGFRVKVD